METCSTSAVLCEAPEDREAVGKANAFYDADDDGGLQKRSPSPGRKRGLKLKIVLKKAELEWLMLSLQEKKGGGVDGAALEQALEKILKRRNRQGDRERQGRLWMPSLDRIMECPETQNFDDNRLDR